MGYNHKNFVNFFLGIFIVSVIGGVLFNYIGKSRKEYILSMPQKYCYDTTRHVSNPAYLLSSTELKEELVDYYKLISINPHVTPILRFGIKTVPMEAPVYVMSYTEDSLLAEIVCFYDRGPTYANNSVRGWVYYKTIHDEPPVVNDSSRYLDLHDVIEIYKRKQSKNDSLL